MVQQYIQQHDGCGNWIHLHYPDLQTTVNRFNRDAVVSANGVSISLTGEAKSYAYHAVLCYQGLKIQFLIYPDLSWGLGGTILASKESEFAYFTAWNLWVKFTGFRG
jgi:hypothetical protein